MSVVSDLIYSAVGLVSSPVWGYRLLRTGKWRTDWRGRFGHAAALTHDRPTLLIHAVSVGEVNTARQLVDELEKRQGDAWRIAISVTTDTGTARARELFTPRHIVVRYPLDFTRSVRRFLDAVKPDVVALIELEVWPTFVDECTRRRIPVGVINGRLSERSYKRYRWIRPLVAGSFGKLAIAAVQDEPYAERFVGLGAPAEKVRVTGTMKWGNTAVGIDEPLRRGADALADAMGIDRRLPLIVCGSTGDREEKLFVETLGDLRHGDKPVQLLMAPRKPERFDEAAAALPGCVRRSAAPDGSNTPIGRTRYFLLDTIGELKKAYALADLAIVGRSFCPLYGSNIIEPIALGKPTIVGPNTGDFREQMEKLLAGGGIEQIPAERLRDTVVRLLDPAAGAALAQRGMRVIEKQQGAALRHAQLIESLMAQRLAGGAAPR